MGAVPSRSTQSLGSMKHWHPYSRIWAIAVVAVAMLYVIGSPLYLWAQGARITLDAAIATMVFAAIAAGVVGILLIGAGVPIIGIAARYYERRRSRGSHAA